MRKNLSSEHTFILRLLNHGAMDVWTITRASLGTKSQTKKILEELVKMGLVERKWEGNGFVYRKKIQ